MGWLIDWYLFTLEGIGIDQARNPSPLKISAGLKLEPPTKALLIQVLNTKLKINRILKRMSPPHIIAYSVHPSDQTSVLSSISAWLGQSHSSGARKGAEQCSAAHSYNRKVELHEKNRQNRIVLLTARI